MEFIVGIIPLVKGKISVVTGNVFQVTIEQTFWIEYNGREYIGGLRSPC